MGMQCRACVLLPTADHVSRPPSHSCSSALPLPPTSHPPQSTTITVTLVPANDNAPTLTSLTTPLTYVENSPGLLVLPSVSVSDTDDTECNPTSLSAAQIRLETLTNDSANETLTVSYPV